MGAFVEAVLLLVGGVMLLWLLFLGAVGAYRFLVGRAEADRRELVARERVKEIMRKATRKKPGGKP